MSLFSCKRLLIFSVLPLMLGVGACGRDVTSGDVDRTAIEESSASNSSVSNGRDDEIAAAKADGVPIVVTTVAPITNIVSNIAGDRMKVMGLVPEGTNSHTFEPRPSDGELLAQADLILVNGLSLEVPSIELAKSIKPADVEIYEIGTNAITQSEWLFDNSFPAEEGKPNPHLWVNPDYAAQYATLAADQLIELDPEGEATYQSNLAEFLQQIEQLDEVTREVVASIPPENRKLLTYHDSWPYWAQKYGFEVIGAVQPSDFSEPSAREIADLVDQIKAAEVPAIFGSEVFPSTLSEQIAREAGVELANTADDDLPGEGSASAIENAQLADANPSHTYIGMMADNLRIFADALGGDASLVDGLDVTNVVE